MRLSWNEIRARAATFAKEWEGAGYEKGQTQLFYRDLFEVFGMPVRRVASFEEPVKRLGDKRGFIDLFWKGVLLVEQKSAGRDLRKAKQQALEYFPGLRDGDLPRYLLLSDFQSFELYDLDEDESASFALADLPRNVEKFGFIIGVQKRTFKDQDPVNIKASELVGKLHDALEESGYTGHDLEQFLVRIVFCLFADDTGIFEPRDIFYDLVETRTSEDGADLGPWIAQLFQVLDTPDSKRPSKLDEDLARFPYVNGELFAKSIRIPSFDAKMRQRLLDACQFDWSEISPAIFGALFQSVMEPEERRAQGAHYTTERNILKVIEPLFLDELRQEFAQLRQRRDTRRRAELRKFQDKLAGLKFFDPACGCGNFLIITYRELRLLELEVLKEIQRDMQMERDSQMRLLGASELSKVDVDQFYGIEIGEFPAKIAETALWMMDHIMNTHLSLEFGLTFARIPLQKAPHIRCADALETSWEAQLDPRECSYVLGNPPFIGAKYQTAVQRAQIRRIAALGGTGGTLDYVCSWFIMASRYIADGDASIGFVATNSITQGEQVAQLWPLLFGPAQLEIQFAHRTFSWGSDARGKAHVHVVILGLVQRRHATVGRRLFSYDDINGEPVESKHSVITPYLFDGGALRNPHLVIAEVSHALNGLPKLVSGSKPIDGGHYIFTPEEKDTFLRDEPGAAALMRPYLGSKEFLQGSIRFILYLGEVAPQVLRQLPKVMERVAAVKEYREQSESPPTRELAATPLRFHINVIPRAPFMVIPEVSSERREYIPIAWLEPPIIPSNKLRVLMDARLWQFGLLSSAMHMSWVRHISGRLKSDFQYGIGVVYNTFPMPPVATEQVMQIEPLASDVLAVRRRFAGASLSDLYDPDAMPTDLRKAHQALDRAVDRLYQSSRFESDRARAEHLFGMYERLVDPMQVGAAPEAPATRRAKRVARKK